jgi:hypothetical protein
MEEEPLFNTSTGKEAMNKYPRNLADDLSRFAARSRVSGPGQLANERRSGSA